MGKTRYKAVSLFRFSLAKVKNGRYFDDNSHHYYNHRHVFGIKCNSNYNYTSFEEIIIKLKYGININVLPSSDIQYSSKQLGM
jgi:hypothetical protein